VEAAKTADQTDSKLTEKKVEKKIEKVKVKITDIRKCSSVILETHVCLMAIGCF
jgi:hypothetical protein